LIRNFILVKYYTLKRSKMNEEKMKGKRRKWVAIGLLLIIVAASTGVAAWWYFSSESVNGFLFPPLIEMRTEKISDDYRMSVCYIEIRAEDYREWLEIEDMVFLLTNNTGYSVLELTSIFNNKSHKYNLDSGNLIDILNNTSSNVTYYDNDYDAHISLNDTFIINGDIVDEALKESWGVRLLLIYNGDLNGRLSKEKFIWLGYGEIR
jgi:hypothetical protein